MNTGTRFATWVYRIAGIYGILVAVPLLFMEEKMGVDFPPPFSHPENYYGFLLIVFAWAVLFVVLSRDPVRYRTMMIPAMLEKFPYAILIFILYSQGRVSEKNLPFGLIDLAFGILFVISYIKTKEPAASA